MAKVVGNEISPHCWRTASGRAARAKQPLGRFDDGLVVWPHHQGFEHLQRAGAVVADIEADRLIWPTELGPIGDLTGEDGGDLVQRQRAHRVVLVDNHD
jgi:hypothetical protein